MNSRKGFIAAGCWTLDHIKFVQGWPAEEELTWIESTERQGGGSGHNFGIDIRKLDHQMPVAAIGLVGDDTEGDFLLARANEIGIDTRQLARTDKTPTAFTDVMSVIATGKRTFFHHPGSNDALSPAHFDFSLSTAKWLHLGLPGLHKTLDSPWQEDANGWVTVLKQAQAAGLKTNIELVSITPARNRQLCLPCLPHLDCLIVNDHEIGSLADIPTLKKGITCKPACLDAARQILELGNNTGTLKQVVVHFPAGAVCVTSEGEELHCDAVEIDPASIISAVGAGDAFAAGMLYALHESWPLHNAMQLAHASAAASLRSATTIGAVEDVNSVLALAGMSRPAGC